jgi:hypothetical protein
MKATELTAVGVIAAFVTLLMLQIAVAQTQPSIAGLIGKIQFRPPDFTDVDSWWYDTDGVHPGIAGCHVGVVSEDNPTPNGRTFGEACQNTLMLIESNPDQNVVHEHVKDIGLPYIVDCKAWCVEDQGATTGKCAITSGPAPCEASARCECE